ncbi:MAG: hypothetical protein V8Q85_07360 [Christensenellales bacterium]
MEDKLASPEIATNYVKAAELSRTIDEKKAQARQALFPMGTGAGGAGGIGEGVT